MKEEAIKQIIREAVDNAINLKWVQVRDGEIYMHISDVEKIIYGIFDENYINNLRKIGEKDGKD